MKKFVKLISLVLTLSLAMSAMSFSVFAKAPDTAQPQDLVKWCPMCMGQETFRQTGSFLENDVPTRKKCSAYPNEDHTHLQDKMIKSYVCEVCGYAYSQTTIRSDKCQGLDKK